MALRQIVSRSRGTPGCNLRGRDRLLVDHLPQGLDLSIAVKRRPARQHFMKNDSEGIDVRQRPDFMRLARACSGAM